MTACRMIAAVLLTLCLLTPAGEGRAQMSPGDGGGAAVEIPTVLTPEVVDGMLARLTDAQIRELLRGELVRRAEDQAKAADARPETLAAIEARLSEMSARIQTRVARWIRAIANLGDRRLKVEARLAEAQDGVGGMIIGVVMMIAAGVAAALVTGLFTRPWRRWLTTPQANGGGYWDRLVRTGALGLLEFLPIIAFVAITRAVAPVLEPRLGPLMNWVWIYHAGVSNAWGVIVIARRAFAPREPQIRIAPLGDVAAKSTYGLIRLGAQIGVAGWLIAGLFPTLGFGFPPAMVTVATAGTLVAALLLFELVRNAGRIRAATGVVFETGPESGAFSRIAVGAAPVLLGLYVFGAWVYWLAHWLEQGVHHLYGPVGTLLVYLALPIFDRIGREIIGTLLNGESEAAERFRGVFRGAWRMLIGIAATLTILWLWGVDLITLATGDAAVGWVDTGLDVIVALLIGALIWRLIGAALYTEKRISSANEDVDPSEIPSASRLDTLTPLFRNILLAFLITVIAMIVLSSMGVDIGPLIASAGIIGIAVGFGAQALVRDVLAGVFFLIDDAFRVGEYIELDNDMRGEVENISVRSLQLRHHRGPVITIPFGELRQITNHNRDWVIYKMMFRMEPDTDPQHLKKVVKRVGAEFMEHPVHGPKFIEPLKSQGVYYIDDDSALVMRVKFKCKPRAQFVLRRDIYHRLRTVFAEEGIRLARRKVEVVGPDDQPADPRAAGALADDAQAPAAT